MTIGEDVSGESDTEHESKLRYLRRVRRSPTCFKINAPTRAHDHEEPSFREELKGKDARKWKETMRVEVDAL